MHTRFVNAPQHTRERLRHSSIHKRHVGRNLQHVLADDTAWDANVLGISAVVEEQILAEVAVLPAAKKAYAARRGVRRHNTRTQRQAVGKLRTHLLHHSGKLMSEDRRRRDHARMVTALPDLEVGSAG